MGATLFNSKVTSTNTERAVGHILVYCGTARHKAVFTDSQWGNKVGVAPNKTIVTDSCAMLCLSVVIDKYYTAPNVCARANHRITNIA